MKALVIIAILAVFAPVIAFGQQSPGTPIEIETSKISQVDLKSTDVLVIINGKLQDNGVVNLFVTGKFDSNSQETRSETFTFSQDNPRHIFELDYPFLPSETYVISVSNGLNLRHVVNWMPISSTQETPTQKPVEKDVSQTVSKTIEEVPIAITKPESTQNQIYSVEQVQSITDENKSLKQTVAKKNAVIMEQVKVIQNLASQISPALYEEQNSKLYFVVDNSEDLIKSLTEENAFLKQEIAKKDAVIMEQIKVIQNLASQISNTSYEYKLGYTST